MSGIILGILQIFGDHKCCTIVVSACDGMVPAGRSPLTTILSVNFITTAVKAAVLMSNILQDVVLFRFHAAVHRPLRDGMF